MSGWLTNGLPLGAVFTGAEQAPFDTQASNGVSPQSIAIPLQQLAALVAFYGNTKDKTTVAGTRYYGSYDIGSGVQLTGISVLVGSTGGTDLWIAELHDSTGALVATSTTSGTTAGTAAGWQQLAFTAPVYVDAGTYFLTLQSNGTTAKPATYNTPQSELLTGSAAGSFGTGAAITPPTTYTANLAPVMLPY